MIMDPTTEIIYRIDRPVVNLCETWQDEVGGISAAIWTATDPATGTAWTLAAAGAFIQNSTVPNANETARLVSKQRWECGPGTWGANTMHQSLTLEFMMKLTDVANIDNTASFFGLTAANDATRASQNIIGLGLATDALRFVTDSGGTETVATPSTLPTLTDWNKYKIFVTRAKAELYLNEVLVAVNAANLPDAPMYLDFYVDTEAGGTGTVALTIVRCWPGDHFGAEIA